VKDDFEEEDRGAPIPSMEFEEEEFALENMKMFEEYVELRVRGIPPIVALPRVFGLNQAGDRYEQNRFNAIERNPVYRSLFRKRLKEIQHNELWDGKQSIYELLSIVRGWNVKDSSRISAIKELNVLAGIVIVDENGKTKVGRSLEDFYKMEGVPKGHKENPHVLPPDIGDDKPPEPAPPPAALPKAPEPIPDRHAHFIAEALQEVETVKPVVKQPQAPTLAAEPVKPKVTVEQARQAKAVQKAQAAPTKRVAKLMKPL